jgi:hypothetical protein
MRCKKCGQYIPEGLDMKQCFCGEEITEEEIVSQEDVSIAAENHFQEERKYTEHDTLTEKQEMQIKQRIDIGIEKLFKALGVCLIPIVLIVFVPMAWLPSRQIHRIHNVDKNQTIAESLGAIPTAIILLIIVGVFMVGALYDSHLLSLVKDLKKKKTKILEVQAKEIKKTKKDFLNNTEYIVCLEENPDKLKRLIYPIDEFPDIQPGDLLKVTLTQQTEVVLSTEKINVPDVHKIKYYDN